jgi:hypothetical protein
MKTCDKCMKHDICGKREVFGAVGCVDDFQQKPQTNAMKIRSMSDEELADFITSQRKSKCNDGICVGSEYCYYNNDNECSCNSSILEWLQSEVPE